QRLQEVARGGSHGVPPRARCAMLVSTAFPRFESYQCITQPRPEGARSSKDCARLEGRPRRDRASGHPLRDGAPHVGCSRLAYMMCRSRVNPRSVRLLSDRMSLSFARRLTLDAVARVTRMMVRAEPQARRVSHEQA